MTRSVEHRITQSGIDRYGRINGDNDIIHYDSNYTKQRGFRGTLAHGLMVMGYAAELAACELGCAWYNEGSLHVKWIAPVCPGDDVKIMLDATGAIRGTVGEETVLIGEARVSKEVAAA